MKRQPGALYSNRLPYVHWVRMYDWGGAGASAEVQTSLSPELGKEQPPSPGPLTALQEVRRLTMLWSKWVRWLATYTLAPPPPPRWRRLGCGWGGLRGWLWRTKRPSTEHMMRTMNLATSREAKKEGSVKQVPQPGPARPGPASLPPSLRPLTSSGRRREGRS